MLSELRRQQDKLGIINMEATKISAKMRKSIERIEKVYGTFEKSYFVERDEDMRVGRGFFDGCDLYCPILQMNVTVAHDGTISPMLFKPRFKKF